MNSIYTDLLDLLDSNQRCALATVVRTRGSTPQKPGAKALFLPDGRIIGTIGGGCLEAETRLRALDAMRDGGCERFDLHLDEAFGWDDGHLCGGTASVLIDGRVAASAALLRATVETGLRGQRAVLAMIVAGPAELVGAKLLLTAQPAAGGEGESQCMVSAADDGISEELQTAIAQAASAVVSARKEMSLAVGACEVYFEPHFSKPSLLICGGGHVGTALCKLAAFLGFEVTVIDDRPEFANSQRHPEAVATICDDVVAAVRRLVITPDTYIVIVTRGHRNDAQVLRAVLHSPAAYLGMIGSRRKVFVMRDSFIEEGVAAAADFQRVHAPIGLDLGAESVEEIALSIAAEMVLVMKGRESGLRKLSDGIREHPAADRGPHASSKLTGNTCALV